MDPKRCHDCGVLPGSEHGEHCDVARCLKCGGQRLSCDCADPGRDRWNGEWPGVAECREFGWYALLEPGVGWVRCGADQPGATEDINRLYIEAVWDTRQCRFVLRDAARLEGEMMTDAIRGRLAARLSQADRVELTRLEWLVALDGERAAALVLDGVALHPDARAELRRRIIVLLGFHEGL